MSVVRANRVVTLLISYAKVARRAYHNKAAIYDILSKASAEALIAIVADPKHLGARICVLSVLRTRAQHSPAVCTST